MYIYIYIYIISIYFPWTPPPLVNIPPLIKLINTSHLLHFFGNEK